MKAGILLFAAATTIFAQQPNCPGFDNCVYTPVVESQFAGQMVRVSYPDLTGRTRTIEVYVRVPNVRTGRMPVVIWAHGGAEGRTAGIAGILQTPSDLTAGAGYITISPAFRPRIDEEQQALCAFMELDEKGCARVNSPSWDRPFDIKAVIDLLHQEDGRQGSPLFGRINLDRIIVGGHSAGSSATISVAGGWRAMGNKRWGGPDYFEDPRPVAFVALSPSAPGYSYNFDTRFKDEQHTWSYVYRPMLFLTGSGDCNEQPPLGRRIAFEKVPGGENSKYLGWFDEVLFSHSHFGEDPCNAPGQRAKCAAFSAAWSSAILAFVDAYARDNATALDYLQKGYAARIPRNLFDIEWTVK